jgi:hypothetical protein
MGDTAGQGSERDDDDEFGSRVEHGASDAIILKHPREKARASSVEKNGRFTVDWYNAGVRAYRRPDTASRL